MNKNYNRTFEVEMGERGIHPDEWPNYENEASLEMSEQDKKIITLSTETEFTIKINFNVEAEEWNGALFENTTKWSYYGATTLVELLKDIEQDIEHIKARNEAMRK